MQSLGFQSAKMLFNGFSMFFSLVWHPGFQCERTGHILISLLFVPGSQMAHVDVTPTEPAEIGHFSPAEPCHAFH